jgi:ABC-type bacteriocin/lantibiotic exporter with double-glycine peptidase domain
MIDLPFMALGLLVVWYIGGNIVYIFIAAIALMLLYAVLIQVPLQKAVGNTFKASAQKNSILIEGLSGLEIIKMLGAETRSSVRGKNRLATSQNGVPCRDCSHHLSITLLFLYKVRRWRPPSSPASI